MGIVRDKQTPYRQRTRATNVSLDPKLVEDAREYNVNLSQAASTGIEEAVRKAKETQWLEENREAIECFNNYVREHGLPLQKYRAF